MGDKQVDLLVMTLHNLEIKNDMVCDDITGRHVSQNRYTPRRYREFCELSAYDSDSKNRQPFSRVSGMVSGR